LLVEAAGGPRLHAVSRAARALGLAAGMGLADARAVCPGTALLPADLEADMKGLEALALWCGRWSPWTAADGEDGVALDITGCAHLFGGERGLMADLGTRLDRLGLTHSTAIAPRLAQAWAWARFAGGGILPAKDAIASLHALPVRALRIEEGTALALERLGLRRVGDLAALPRAALLTRFGRPLVDRLEALLGEAAEPFTPLREPLSFTARLAWPEPIGRTEDIVVAADRLLADVAEALERAQRGARRFRLQLCRIDGEALRLEVRTGRPVRTAEHVRRLLALRWDGLDLGLGVELMRLEALETAPLAPQQVGLAAAEDGAALGLLLDRLAARLGPGRVVRPEPVQSHVPERAQRLVPASRAPGAGDWLAAQPRPLRLLPRPEPVRALAMVPDSPPVRLDWRGEGLRIAQGRGPERILPEWWREEDGGARARDFYRLTAEDGRGLWVFREGLWGEAAAPTWRVLGLFA
jgi:protein ImuB